MKARTKNDNDISFCIKNEILIYPVYCDLKNRWYIEVNNRGRIKRYDKEIETGKVLSSKKLQVPVEKTARYYTDLIIKVNGTNKENSNTGSSK